FKHQGSSHFRTLLNLSKAVRLVKPHLLDIKAVLNRSSYSKLTLSPLKQEKTGIIKQ
ncbi:UNVERIFIED_CONTAM: hypothetical protein K2H54_065845, partial [Gekko kuhli]